MKTLNNNKPMEILLVEDNPGDVRLTLEAFKNSSLNKNINIIQDGVQALSFLRKEGEYNKSPKPDLILLDLNLPKKDGRQVLKEIKNDKDLKEIPVLILTTSEEDDDIIKSYNLHANCYITKPVDIDHFFDVIKMIESFWFQTAKLPRRNNDGN